METLSYRVEVDLPPELHDWLARETQRKGMTMANMISFALTRYAEQQGAVFNMTHTRTWQLCGTLEVAEPDPDYVTGQDDQGHLITNYAEHVDAVLFGEN